LDAVRTTADREVMPPLDRAATVAGLVSPTAVTKRRAVADDGSTAVSIAGTATRPSNAEIRSPVRSIARTRGAW
jgi:hypothetical protein